MQEAATDRRRFVWRLAVGAVVLGVLPGCTGTPRRPLGDQSALLLTIDTWRSDALGAGGNPVVRTPWLDRFFRRSLQFSQMFSPIPSTLSSHT